MSPMHKSITALAASALLATVGFAAAQSTTTVDTATQVIPAQPTGIIELAKPKNTVAPTDKQADGPQGMENTLMTTGVVNGITRPSVGDHATPNMPGDDTTVAVTKETTTSTTVTPPVEVAAPEPVAAPAADPAPEPMPAPKADRN
jgi:hypothetical protein